MNKINKGDYVLATKWGDGDPRDHWCVGFFAGMTAHSVPRYEVVDGDGNLFRGNGFRRCKKISAERGEFLLANAKKIEQFDRSVWWWARKKILPQ